MFRRVGGQGTDTIWMSMGLATMSLLSLPQRTWRWQGASLQTISQSSYPSNLFMLAVPSVRAGWERLEDTLVSELWTFAGVPCFSPQKLCHFQLPLKRPAHPCFESCELGFSEHPGKPRRSVPISVIIALFVSLIRVLGLVSGSSATLSSAFKHSHSSR